MNVFVYKDNSEAIMPIYGTEKSACFDLSACLVEGQEITVYDKDNNKTKRKPFMREDGTMGMYLFPFERVLVPTGLIFDLELDQTLRLHPRSGLSIKQGVTLINCEGVVDSDYVDPTFIPLVNYSNQLIVIVHGDRICQGEVVKATYNTIKETHIKPTQKTDRLGGFGSTGVNNT